MAEGSSGDSSPQDRRQEQIGSDRSSSFRTSSGNGVHGDKWLGNNKGNVFAKKQDLEKVILDKSKTL